MKKIANRSFLNIPCVHAVLVTTLVATGGCGGESSSSGEDLSCDASSVSGDSTVSVEVGTPGAQQGPSPIEIMLDLVVVAKNAYGTADVWLADMVGSGVTRDGSLVGTPGWETVLCTDAGPIYCFEGYLGYECGCGDGGRDVDCDALPRSLPSIEPAFAIQAAFPGASEFELFAVIYNTDIYTTPVWLIAGGDPYETIAVDARTGAL